MPATAGIVAQYPVAPYTTPVDGDDLAAALVVSHDNTTATAHVSHDADATIHFQSSTLAGRPAAGTAHRKWITSDGLRVYYDTGGAWSEIDYLCKTAGGTVVGATTFSALITAVGGVVVTGGAAGAGTVYKSAGAGLTIQAITGVTFDFALINPSNASYIMNVATGTLVANFPGGMSGTLQTAAQPLVTSLGVLVSLNVTGTIAGAGGITAFAGEFSIERATNGTDLRIQSYASKNLHLNQLGNDVNIGSTNYLVVKNAGQVLIGTTVATSAAAGEAVVANAKALRSANAGATDTFPLISGGANNQIIVGGGTAAVTIGPTIVTGAGGGELVFANAKALRGVNAAGTTTRHLISFTGTDNVVIAGDTGAVLIGGAIVAGSAAGDLTLANGKYFKSINAANTTAFHLISLDGNNTVRIGAEPQVISFGAPSTITGSTAGDIVLANNRHLRTSNNAGTGAKHVIGMTNADIIYVGLDVVGPVAFGLPASTTSAAAGDIVVAKNTSLRRANNGGTNANRILTFGGNDDWMYFDGDAVAGYAWGTATVSGAAVGDHIIRNNHPIRGVNGANTAAKALIQISGADKVAIDSDALGTTFGAGAVFAGAVSGITTLAMGGALSGVTSLSMSGALSGATTGNFSGDLTASGNILRANSTRFNTPQQTAGITSAAVTIFTGQANGAAQVWVCGSDGAGNRFIDLVNVLNNQTRQVSSITFIGAPAARTYAVSGNNLTMSIAAGTYTVIAVPFEVVLA